MAQVADLYDDLLELNTKRNGDTLYPIHKKLDYQNSEINNLYSYLLSKYDLPTTGKLLDCGCGVGYGAQLLAKENPELEVHGISLSEGEIGAANKMAAKAGLGNRCHFKVQSFDDVESDTYDCIIAVESLKHSPNIKHTMTQLLKSLKPNGLLIIIEDVGKSPFDNFATKRQCADWELQRIFTIDDYHKTDELVDKQVEVMTPQMMTPNYFSVLFRILGSELMTFGERIGLLKNRGASIIRGGIYQEYLYVSGKLDYMILSGRKV